MGCTKTRISRLSARNEEREIDFLHFWPISCQVFVIFDDFSKFHNVFRAMGIPLKNGKDLAKDEERPIFTSQKLNFSGNYLWKMQF